MVSTACLLFGCIEEESTGEKPQPEPLFQEQWALAYDESFYEAYSINADAHIHAENALHNYTGRGVRIAIIDHGINPNHEEFTQTKLTVVNARDKSNEITCYSEGCEHGSHVTGIISADINDKGIRGLAPEAEIVFIHLDLNGYLSDREFLAAFDIAEEYKPDIILCSWGTGNPSDALKNKLKDFSESGRDGLGTIIVYAVGNEGNRLDSDESMLDSVIAVGATDEDNLRAGYSNFGDGLDIMAPGGYRLGITTVDTGKDGYALAEFPNRFAGTSAAAPLVAASIALMLEANPFLSKDTVYSILTESADKIGNIPYVDSWNAYYGFGKINIDRAISRTLKTK